MLTLERSWMRLVARSARIPVPRIVEAGLVTVTRKGDLASSSSGNMFSCPVFLTVRRRSEGGVVGWVGRRACKGRSGYDLVISEVGGVVKKKRMNKK